jgi:hypothetical protein
MYAIVKTIEEAEALNTYIRDMYYTEIACASMEQWTDIVAVEDGYALEIMEEWVSFTVPDFVVNGIEFVEIGGPESINKTLETT